MLTCSNHIEAKIDDSVSATMNIFTATTGLTPKFKVYRIRTNIGGYNIWRFVEIMDLARY